jgi:hypothetical protein
MFKNKKKYLSYKIKLVRDQNPLIKSKKKSLKKV